MLTDAPPVPLQMNLSTKITKAIDGTVESFLREVSVRYDIRQEDLSEAWKRVAGTTTTTKKKGGAIRRQARPSGYQNFAKTARPQIREIDPSMSFGDISKEVSRRWRALTEEERLEYNRVAAGSAITPPPSAAAVSTPASEDGTDTGSVAGVGYSPVLLDDEDDEPPSRPSTPEEVAEPAVSFASMGIRSLREECKKNNLPLKGTSTELVARLTAHARSR